MSLAQINFDDNEEDIIMLVRRKFKLNKPEAVKKIVSEYKIKNGE